MPGLLRREDGVAHHPHRVHRVGAREQLAHRLGNVARRRYEAREEGHPHQPGRLLGVADQVRGVGTVQDADPHALRVDEAEGGELVLDRDLGRYPAHAGHVDQARLVRVGHHAEREGSVGQGRPRDLGGEHSHGDQDHRAAPQPRRDALALRPVASEVELRERVRRSRPPQRVYYGPHTRLLVAVEDDHLRRVAGRGQRQGQDQGEPPMHPVHRTSSALHAFRRAACYSSDRGGTDVT